MSSPANPSVTPSSTPSATPSGRWLRRAALGGAAACLLLLPDLLEAQRRRGHDWPPQQRRTRAEFAVEAGGLFSTVSGDGLGGAGDGTGLDVLALIGSGPIGLGIGWQRQSHALRAGDDVEVDGFFLEPRVALPLAVGNFTPYAFGRVSRLTRAPVAGFSDVESEGTGLGGGIGTLMWLAPNAQLTVAAMWQELRFDGADVQAGGGRDRVTAGSWSARVGLTIGFDRWGR